MKFLNCEMEFRCSKDWDGMSLTKDLNIRHCDSCQKDVYFCHTVADLDKAINERHCVAFISDDAAVDSELKDLAVRLDGINEGTNNRAFTSRTLGLPKDYLKGKSFWDLDKEAD